MIPVPWFLQSKGRRSGEYIALGEMPITLPALKRFQSFIVCLSMALFEVEHAYNFTTNTLPEPQVTSYSSQPSVRNLCQLLTKRSKMRSKMLPMPTEQLDSYVEEKSLLEMAKTHFFPQWSCPQWSLRLLCRSVVPTRAVHLTDLALATTGPHLGTFHFQSLQIQRDGRFFPQILGRYVIQSWP